MTDVYCSHCGFLKDAYAGGDAQCPKCLKREVCSECGKQIREKPIAFDNGISLVLFCSTRCENQWVRENSPQGIIDTPQTWPDSFFDEDQAKSIKGKWELDIPQHPYVVFRQE